jgi:hypothetical protein
MDLSILFSVAAALALLCLAIACALPSTRAPAPREPEWDAGDPGPYYERDPKGR